MYLSSVLVSTNNESVLVYNRVQFSPYFFFSLLLYQSYIKFFDRSRTENPTWTDLFSVNFVLLTCIADSSSENITRLLKFGLAMIFLDFSFSLPSVVTNFMSFAEVLHCFAKHRVVHKFIKVLFKDRLRLFPHFSVQLNV